MELMRQAVEQRYIELIRADASATKELLNAYASSHQKTADESDNDYFERCAEQDFEDGPDGCCFPAFHAAAGTSNNTLNGSNMKFICNRKKFATLAEACAQAKNVWKKTGIFVAVESKS